MLKFISEHLKEFGIFSAVAAGLVGAGILLNNLVNWNYITYFFVIIRKALAYIDFMVDTTTLMRAMFIGMTAQIIYLSARATAKIITYFR